MQVYNVARHATSFVPPPRAATSMHLATLHCWPCPTMPCEADSHGTGCPCPGGKHPRRFTVRIVARFAGGLTSMAARGESVACHARMIWPSKTAMTCRKKKKKMCRMSQRNLNARRTASSGMWHLKSGRKEREVAQRWARSRGPSMGSRAGAYTMGWGSSGKTMQNTFFRCLFRCLAMRTLLFQRSRRSPPPPQNGMGLGALSTPQGILRCA